MPSVDDDDGRQVDDDGSILLTTCAGLRLQTIPYSRIHTMRTVLCCVGICKDLQTHCKKKTNTSNRTLASMPIDAFYSAMILFS